MPDILAEALALPGLGWLLAAILLAGVVRGFSGFGSAMIIMPVASSVLSPFAAIAFLTVVEFFGPLPNLPNALRNGTPREAGVMLLGAALALPIGIAALSIMDPDIFSWTVSVVVLVLLGLLATGWRYRRTLTPRVVAGIGATSGFLAGVSGLAGPPVIMSYMAGTRAVAVIRANFLLYLLGIDMLMLGGFLLIGRLDPTAVVLGLALVLPYLAANILGARLFNPGAERVYRGVAYVIIAMAAVFGLPIWE